MESFPGDALDRYEPASPPASTPPPMPAPVFPPMPVSSPPPVPAPMAGGAPAVRASDTEREHVVKLLTDACAEGRLTLEELSGRVGSAYSAVTRADLVPLTADLPVATDTLPATAETTPVVAMPNRKRKWLVTVMSSHKSKGNWRLSERTAAVTIMGESSIDLRQAVIESPDIAITLYLLMGEQSVIVPQGVEVEVTGFVFMGEKKVDVTATRPRPGVPRLHIRVVGMMGEVRIRTG